MISFEEAFRIVQSNLVYTGSEEVPFTSAAGRILDCDLFSDMDMPPFDKSAVDGYALKHNGDLPVPEGLEFRIAEIIPAGKVPEKRCNSGECARIMTGSMIPEGADTVVMIENTAEVQPGWIRIQRPEKSRNICYQAEDIRRGDKVLERGTRIGAPEIAILAATGNTHVKVARKPLVGVVSTGNELTEPGHVPSVSQIRNSNAYQLVAQLEAIPVNSRYLGIASDSPGELREMILRGMEHDVLLLTGGVSMGDFDFVPSVLSGLGVEILFKSIAIQPGKPTVFGRKGDHFVFGLPGNPVSAFVLTELLVRPFLLGLMGHTVSDFILKLPMGAPYRRRSSPRKTVVPVNVQNNHIYPIEYHGSAHINAYSSANAMLMIEPGITELLPGQPADVRLL